MAAALDRRRKRALLDVERGPGPNVHVWLHRHLQRLGAPLGWLCCSSTLRPPARLELLRRNLHAIDLKSARHRRVLRQQGAQPVPENNTLNADAAGFLLLPIHHVQLAIPRNGEPQSRSLWGDVLGMQELDKPPVLAARGGCWFRGGDLEVHLGVEEPFAPARKAHPGVLVDGLPALARRLEQAGYPVTWDGEFPGHDRFYSADPFDNRLEFLQPHSH